MKVALYQDPRGGGIGGGEFVVAVLAQALRLKGHAVDYVHHEGPGFVARVADLFGTDLTGVSDRPLAAPGSWNALNTPVWRRRAAMRGWMKDASAGYDLFICVTHGPPPYCHARVGVLYVLFPIFDRRESWPWDSQTSGFFGVWAWLRKRIHERWWQERLASYSATAVISNFTRRYTRDYWGIDPHVIYPPVEIAGFQPGEKANRIVVLGRFAAAKKQAELVRAFAAGAGRLPEWVLRCVGGVGQNPADQSYYAQVEVMAGAGVELAANVSRDRLLTELSSAKVFWHGMGIDATRPEAEEHFGIATVEAMAAGCVPVVPRRGGQPEIVTDGETGFLCDDLGEYVERTTELAADPIRLARMSAAALDAAARFARPVFVERMMSVIGPLLSRKGVS